jgi:predicted XRE-type DNA-binding protein
MGQLDLRDLGVLREHKVFKVSRVQQDRQDLGGQQDPLETKGNVVFKVFKVLLEQQDLLDQQVLEEYRVSRVSRVSRVLQDLEV